MWLPAHPDGGVLGVGGSPPRHHFPHPNIPTPLVQHHQHHGRSTGVRLGESSTNTAIGDNL